MTSLVTGAGLVGTAYACEALKHNEAIVFYDTKPDLDYLHIKLGDTSFSTVPGDLRDLPALIDTMAGHAPEVVVHTAGLIGNSVSDHMYTGFQVNIQGTINALEAVRLTGVRKFVHVSTFGVYDLSLANGGSIDEDFPRGGKVPYPASKIANEHIVESYAARYGFEFVIVRPANVFGYGHFRGGSGGGKTMQSLVEAGISGKPLTIPAARARDFEYIYCKDLGRALDLAVKTSAASNTSINIGNGNIVPFDDLVETLHSVFPNLEVAISQANEPHQSAQQPMNISRAKDLLGWEPEYSIVNAFKDYVEEYKTAHLP